ncbi:NAD(P)-dependent glycerol-3-phosphate dehydrogenase [Candidatus Bipolaricaulota bacterium]|nr:NAD(P)-dependent glycerol-3-phosphate dehydrogenase [Candidatus Bipolaricaulota bacterium]
MQISVIGAGSWGTSFARLTANNGHSTYLWVRREGKAEKLTETRENRQYLPGYRLPEENLTVSSSLSRVVNHAEILFFAVPSFAMREIARRANGYLDGTNVHLVNLAKGLEAETFNTMSEVLAEEIESAKIFTLSGPSHAEEVAAGDPTAVVLAGDTGPGSTIQKGLSTDSFRIYLSSDLKGVEYCGAIKNIVAVATGVAQGLGFGDNTTGTLIARGLAEMVRFGNSLGATKETFFGLAGVGDLVATCTSEHSRNRRFGVRLGKGEKSEDIMEEMEMVAEGVHAAKIVHSLAEERDIAVPITNSLYRVIYEGSSPSREVSKLMSREFKVEKV